MRREFHRHPELSWQETETAARIRRELDEMGIPYEEVVGTGTIATLKGKKDHPVIGLRCDIDALPIKEVKELPYRSENDGVMHACGHDGHVTVLLGFAKYLQEHKDELENDVVLIFQPAEEGPGGAQLLVDAGLFEKHPVRCIIGCHIFPQVPQGKVACRKGAMMARNGKWMCIFTGKVLTARSPSWGMTRCWQQGQSLQDCIPSFPGMYPLWTAAY